MIKYSKIYFFLAILLVGCITISSKTYPPLMKAAELGNIVQADQELKKGVSVHSTTIGNQTALHIAALANQKEMVIWLLSQEAYPLAQDDNGMTPVDVARNRGNEEIAQLLDDYINLRLEQERTFQEKEFDAFEIALAKDPRQHTLLHEVGLSGNLAWAEAVLMERDDLDINAKNAVGMTPLHKAIAGGNLALIQFFLDYGAEIDGVDKHNNTGLIFAIVENRSDIIELLLKNGANKDISSNLLGTPVEYATRYRPELINLLSDK